MSLKLVREIVITFDDCDADDVFCMAPLAVATVTDVVTAAGFDDKLVFAAAHAILFDGVIDDADVVNCGWSSL